MNTIGRLGVILTLTLSCFLGCKESSEVQKGAVGESCTRRDDCGGSLVCIENRCASANVEADAGGAGAGNVAGGGLGESCTRRGDCQAGLACFDQVCVNEADATGDDAGVIQVRGGRGETCTARNDCGSGLACVSSRCRENDYPIKAEAKSCFRVQCEAKADCCAKFTPSVSCGSWKSDCDLDPTSLACSYYEAYCVCGLTCEDSQCVTDTSCTGNTDCGAASPWCVATKCSQCRTGEDCGTGTECVDGQCRAPCERNEQCPLFYACQTGKCVDVGCSSDRECFFASGDPRAKCSDKECSSPCDKDAECTRAFEVCEQGRCVFAGCQSDEECRVYLNLQNQVGLNTAVCKLPE